MEADVSSLGLWLPLPYRVLGSFILGVWLFGLNLHYFDAVRIDAGPLLRYTRSGGEPPLHRRVYEVAAVLSLVLAANLAALWAVAGRDPALVAAREMLPVLLFVTLAGVLVWPGSWHRRGRWRFLRMLRRVLVGGLSVELRFADVLLADALTSYARLLGDLLACACLALGAHGAALLVPVAVALPYAARLRQCLTEYVRAARRGLPPAARAPHLYNAAKYASAFPVIVCSALQRAPAAPVPPAALARAWLAAVAANSAFSFYWDVARDWELALFPALRALLFPPSSSSSSPPAPPFPWGLRRHRHFVACELYYAAVAVDLLLRATWSLKLSPHLDRLDATEGGVWTLELLELLRRWLWLFLRVEKEWVLADRGGMPGGHGLIADGGEAFLLQEYEE